MKKTKIDINSVFLSRSGKTILENINLKVLDGQHWAILGPNGSGKTTLLNIISAYLWPMEGSVRVLGALYGETDIWDVRRRIGYVSSALYELVPTDETFYQTVLSGRFGSFGIFDQPRQEDHDRAAEIIDFLACSHLAGERYATLSFGEKQKALLGRALMSEPEILILDEPCEGLDMPSRERILKALDRITGKNNAPSILFVTHRVEEIPPSITHALILKNGKMLASGEKCDTITSENISAAMDIKVEISSRNGRIYAFIG